MKLYGGLLWGLLAISSAATLIKLTEAPPLVVAMYRMVISAAVLWVLYPFPTGARRWKEWIPLVAGGFFLALHFALWISSLSSTSVASSLVLVTMNPLFVAAISVISLKETLPPAVIAGTLIAMVGAAILIAGDKQASFSSFHGDILAVGGALAMSIYMTIGRQSRHRETLGDYLKWVYSFAGLFLLFAALGSGVPLFHYSPETFGMLFIIALVPQIMGHSLINWSLRHVHTSVVAMIILLEPLLGTLLAWWILDEAPAKHTGIGGALILSGIFTALILQRKGNNIDTITNGK